MSVGQKNVNLHTVKVGGLKKILPLGRSQTTRGPSRFDSQMTGSSSKFDGPQICSPLTYQDSQYIYGKI